MYWDYVREREGVEVVETENGFALIKMVNQDMLYLVDIYVKPDFRRSGEGRRILQEVEGIAKELGATRIQGSVAPQANGSTESALAVIATGFKISHSDNELIYFIKEL